MTRALLAIVAVVCLSATGVLLAAGPTRHVAPAKRIVRVAVVHRTVTRRLPRRVKVKHVYVSAPAPAPKPAPAPAPARVTPAVYTVPHPSSGHTAPPSRRGPRRPPRPSRSSGARRATTGPSTRGRSRTT